MTAAIRITSTGIEEALAALSAAAALGDDPTEMFDAIGGAMVASTQIRFEQQAAPDGSPWPPSIRALTEGGLTLSKSGRLAQSITHQADPGGVEWGTDVAYAGPHQHGAVIRPVQAKALRFKLPGKLGWRTASEVILPKRAFLGVDAEDEAEILEIVADFARGVGFGGEA